MNKKSLSVLALTCFTAMLSAQTATATSYNLTFTQLTGLTGGTLSATAVYRAALSGIDTSNTPGIQSLTISDNSSGLGGATGQFSGFDLDAVKLSYDFVSSATAVNGTTGLNIFDFTNNSVFTPGSQRTPVDPKLFGTNASGDQVNNGVATLGLFDGESTTAIPGADGFLSMGDGGKLSLNFSSPLFNTAGLYLYIGEVGDNGEVAASNIIVSDVPVNPVPEPATMLLFGTGIAGLAGIARRKRI